MIELMALKTIHQANLKCNKGSTPSVLVVTSQEHAKIGGQLVANLKPSR
ncbi:hypothetical protein [Pedobacter sp. WC2423]